MADRREIIAVRNLKRSGKDGTFSRWDTGTFQCDVLERPKPGLVDDHPCVPPTDRGYDMNWTVGVHPIHGDCYEIMVPGRTAILVHSANVFEQLLGCFAPGEYVDLIFLAWEGQTINHAGVQNSKVTLAALLADLKGQPCRLIIKEV